MRTVQQEVTQQPVGVMRRREGSAVMDNERTREWHDKRASDGGGGGGGGPAAAAAKAVAAVDNDWRQKRLALRASMVA
jgi:hypothetical protein